MKYYIKATISLFLLALLCTLVFAACKQKEAKEPGMLATPEGLRVEDEVLRWNAVENAAGYVVEIDGEEYEVAEESYDTFLKFTKSGKYSIRVKAQSDLGEYEDSAWTEILEYSPVCATGWVLRPINDGTEYEVVGDSKATLKGNLLIPGEYDGKKVTRIAQDAFKDCTKLTGVVIPSTIKIISRNAFYGCSNLKRVACPNTVETIDSGAFYNCSALTDFHLPRWATGIGDYAFRGCSSLKEITIPEDLKTLQYGTFLGCSALRSVVVPAGIEKIERYAFARCDQLTSITVEKDNRFFYSEGNCVIRKEDSTLVVGIATSVIPETVKTIGEDAFAECCALTAITIPGNVETIQNNAFFRCKNLKTITLCEGIRTIGDVKKGGECSVFWGCTSLAVLEIPASVEEIGYSLFDTCLNRQSLTVAPGNKAFRSEGNCIIRISDQMVLQGSDAGAIPAGVKSIGMGAFANYPHAEIVIPEGVESIGAFAFGNSALVRVVLPGTLKEIGSQAFSGESVPSSLQEINLPEGLTKIGGFAFYKCTQLRHLTIPSGVIEIGKDVFSGCSRLTLLLPKSVEKIWGATFANVTVYTDATSGNMPDGWENGMTGLTSAWVSGAWLMPGCVFQKDENGVYVSSYIFQFSSSSGLIPYRAGYTFMGWATEPDSDVVVYAKEQHLAEDGSIEKESAFSLEDRRKIADGTILYAVWEANA